MATGYFEYVPKGEFSPYVSFDGYFECDFDNHTAEMQYIEGTISLLTYDNEVIWERKVFYKRKSDIDLFRKCDPYFHKLFIDMEEYCEEHEKPDWLIETEHREYMEEISDRRGY